jgi:hypothetical protein
MNGSDTHKVNGDTPNNGMNLTGYSALFQCAHIFTPPKRTVSGRLSQRYVAKAPHFRA